MKEEFKSVENETYLKGGVSGTEETAFINARTLNIDESIRIKGFGYISQNDETNNDKLEITFAIPGVADVYSIVLIDQKMFIGSNFLFEILLSDIGTENGERVQMHVQTTIHKQLQPTEIVSGSGSGYNIGKDHAFQVKFKHSQKSKPESKIKIQGLTIEFLG